MVNLPIRPLYLVSVDDLEQFRIVCGYIFCVADYSSGDPELFRSLISCARTPPFLLVSLFRLGHFCPNRGALFYTVLVTSKCRLLSPLLGWPRIDGFVFDSDYRTLRSRQMPTNQKLARLAPSGIAHFGRPDRTLTAFLSPHA